MSERMVIFDALEMRFRNVKLRGRNSKCSSCGDCPTITDVASFDYNDFCQTNCNLVALIQLPPQNSITIEEFHRLRSATDHPLIVIDVRPKVQFEITHLAESVSIPWPTIPRYPERLVDVCKNNATVYIMCRRGNASKETTDFLIKEHGISNAINVMGGMNALSFLDSQYPLY